MCEAFIFIIIIIIIITITCPMKSVKKSMLQRKAVHPSRFQSEVVDRSIGQPTDKSFIDPIACIAKY
ncbi:hypothetical protein EYF80_034269 [Liparis tanakae]|uniref:Uncharacterized protein n=1 Tax=Liparis tanakae TaxID=230148 RepID=A0A4Z2GPN7_9TELE|nr:hypothetical protein EYF80_034269 [Liparis tanakae]